MLNNEWYQVTDLLEELWDKWNFNNVEMEVWREKLIRYDIRAVKSAIKTYYASEQNTRNKPKLSKINIIAADINRSFSQPEEQKTPESDYIIKCVEAGSYFVEGTEFPARLHDRTKTDRLAEFAENDRQKHEALYGGKWEVVRLWDATETPESPKITPERKWEILEEKIQNAPNPAVKQMYKRMQEATEGSVMRAMSGAATKALPEVEDKDDIGF